VPGFFVKRNNVMDQILGFEVSEVVGVAAGVLTSASMLPQVIKMIKEKQASQVSVLMICVLISGISLWIWYGIMKEDKPIIYTNVFSLLINIFMAICKYKYKDNKTT
jgi:MtN3 and saliva related transmembrane protein